MKNERTEHRIKAFIPGSATILGHPDVTVPCNIRDFSHDGMCLYLAQEVDPGRILKVEWANHFLVGRVQRVGRDQGSVEVGLELLQCSKWTEPARIFG